MDVQRRDRDVSLLPGYADVAAFGQCVEFISTHLGSGYPSQGDQLVGFVAGLQC
jgi:hypothetical protein